MWFCKMIDLRDVWEMYTEKAMARSAESIMWPYKGKLL